MLGVHGKLAAQFGNYESYHRTVGNQITHEIGIPLILLSLLGLLSRLVLFEAPITAGLLFWAGSMLWYFAHCWERGRFLWSHFTLVAPYAIVTFGAYLAGTAMPVPALLIIFVLGWVLQGVGHFVFEKRSPAFFTHLKHLWIGPFWVFSRIFRE